MRTRSPVPTVLLSAMLVAIVILTLWSLWTAALPAFHEAGGAVEQVSSGY